MAASLFKWLFFLATFTLMGFTGRPKTHLLPAGYLHPFYVSVTEFNFNAGEKLLEITSKVFLDDLEKALKKQHNQLVELSKPANAKQTGEMVSNYFKKRLLVKIDGKPVTLEFVGYESEGASVWVYFQVSNTTAVKTIDISNTLLYEMYPNQISIMHAQVGNNKKSTRITNPEANAGFEF
jgi:hypothetical protein